MNNDNISVDNWSVDDYRISMHLLVDELAEFDDLELMSYMETFTACMINSIKNKTK